ncbi:hypothetical protein GCM10023116_14840 [Kistimonas scapharcae]|uniref:Uncharacterized protein n=1 Tax=Kistimonas scapharcae TaxID=1036133 RepID=A0ABP8V1L1_9GAMM
MKPAAIKGIDQRLQDMHLSYQLLEGTGTPLSGKYLITHWLFITPGTIPDTKSSASQSAAPLKPGNRNRRQVIPQQLQEDTQAITTLYAN